MAELRIGLIGGGVIGRTHVRAVAATQGVRMVGIADPGEAGRALAEAAGLPWYGDHGGLLDGERCDAVILAAPNQLHVSIGLDCIARGLPLLVEKPIADTLAGAQRLALAATAAGVPLLVGHHRRHNPIIRRAKAAIESGLIGRLVSMHVMAAFLKPDSYFEVEWRRRPGGGPVMINLSHEIDLIRYLGAEIESVQAMTSNAVRGFEVDDTAAVACKLAGGALASVALSDTAAGPWSWDLASGENPAFRGAPVDSHFISGTVGSLTLPRLAVWCYAGARGWDQTLDQSRLDVVAGDPYAAQIEHFAAVATGRAAPLVSGEDATATLAAIEAVKLSAVTGAAIAPSSLLASAAG